MIMGLLQQQRRTCSLKSFYDCLVKAYVYCKTPRLSRACLWLSFWDREQSCLESFLTDPVLCRETETCPLKRQRSN